ncbi:MULTISPECIES: hypothetical protein [Inquilinus]|uniref:DNA repair ATPase RecN n=2 Tax=Inquilinus TaxID=171673 RepID=A0ABU1JU37_9PROT|nr:hypothetical protein [Inquilinus ginsengisoli]MDR6291818.1 DNA repair ATPase RecN [Inquilinus ginsengisoli]
MDRRARNRHILPMTDAPDSLVLRYLRQIDQKVDRLAEDVHDLKVRMTAVEENLAGVHRRIDRVEARLERIERRLDLVETGI